MDSDYRFPLFEEIIHGTLDPVLPSMAADTGYEERLKNMICCKSTDNGRYQINFPAGHHLKQRYYRNLLLSETVGYCNEMVEMLSKETLPPIRTYYRDLILDKHLTCCLKRLSEKLHKHNLTTFPSRTDLPPPTTESICNSYILHFLKVCLTKAYLEIQHTLSDVVVYSLTEQTIYSTYFDALPPVYCWLSTKPATKQPQHNAAALTQESPPGYGDNTAPAKENLPPEDSGKFLQVNDIVAKTGWSEKTVRRYLQEGSLKGSKPRGKWLISQEDFENYMKKNSNN